MSRSGDATDHWPHNDADDAHYDLVQLGEELAHDSRALAHRADHDAERDAEYQHSCIHTAAHLIDSYTGVTRQRWNDELFIGHSSNYSRSPNRLSESLQDYFSYRINDWLNVGIYQLWLLACK